MILLLFGLTMIELGIVLGKFAGLWFVPIGGHIPVSPSAYITQELETALSILEGLISLGLGVFFTFHRPQNKSLGM